MAEIIQYTIESFIILSLLYTAYRLFFEKDKNLKFNRFYLLCSVILGLIIPLLRIPLQTASDRMEVFSDAILLPGVIITDVSANASRNLYSLEEILLVIYLAGVLFFSARLVRNLIQFYQLVGQHRHDLRQSDGVKVLHVQPSIPSGSFLNYVFLNSRDIAEQDGENLLLEHEKVHILQKHSIDILFIEIVQIIFWFNPLFYLFKLSVREVHEYLADAAVVRKSNTSNYMDLLANKALQIFDNNLVNYFNKSQTIKRMNMIKSRKKRAIGWNWLMALTASIGLVYVFACESNAPEQQDADPMASAELPAEDVNNLLPAGEEIFKTVDQAPTPDGGIKVFFKHIMREITYPEQARAAGIQGKVFVEFVVDKTGAIRNTRILEGIGYGCDDEALRVVRNSPNWQPGMNEGEHVNVRMVVPISFKLDDKDKKAATSEAPKKQENSSNEVAVVGYRK